MKDLGPLKYFLGIEVAQNTQGMYLCQQKYTLDILINTCLLGAKPLSLPMEQNHQLGQANGPFLNSPDSYRQLVDGRLIYLAITRPNLVF